MKTLVLLFSLFLISACSDYDTSEADTSKEYNELVAVVNPTMGNDVDGVVRFMKQQDGIRVVGEFHGLEPNSTHGFHIHQFGDCTAMDGTSAGGHFNPMDMPHSGPNDDRRHVGDLGNLEADENGTADFDFTDSVISFEGVRSILGLGIIVHAGEDDLESQPTGGAGARLACGVIGVAQSN